MSASDHRAGALRRYGTAKPRLVAALALWALSAELAAIDLQPGEVRAPPPGITFGQLSFVHAERASQFVDGREQPGDPQLDVSLLQLRLGHAFEALERPAVAYVQTQFADIRPGGDLAGLEGDSGLGDTSFLLAIWPYANRATEAYFGAGVYLTLPTGGYSPRRLFNAGANRYNAALQVGYQRRLVQRLDWMVAVDGVVFGDNDEYFPGGARLEQAPLYTVQSGFAWRALPRVTLSAAWFHSLGGETEVNGLSRNDDIHVHRYQLSTVFEFKPGRLMLQYGSDLTTENGFREHHRAIVRYNWRF